jgi:hypothetical protein
MEPYVPAMLSLVSQKVLAYWQDPETEFMLTDLYSRATDEQRALSDAGSDGYEASMRESGKEPNYDDPTNHRYTQVEVEELTRAAVECTVTHEGSFGDVMRTILTGRSDPTVH